MPIIYRDHYIEYMPGRLFEPNFLTWRYWHISLGYNGYVSAQRASSQKLCKKRIDEWHTEQETEKADAN